MHPARRYVHHDTTADRRLYSGQGAGARPWYIRRHSMSEQQWHMAKHGHQIEPLSEAEIVSNIQNGSADGETLRVDTVDPRPRVRARQPHRRQVRTRVLCARANADRSPGGASHRDRVTSGQ